jgi:hypothetical protein
MKQVTVVNRKRANSSRAPSALERFAFGYELKNHSKIVDVSSSDSAAFVLRSIIYPSTKAHEAYTRSEQQPLTWLLP